MHTMRTNWVLAALTLTWVCTVSCTGQQAPRAEVIGTPEEPAAASSTVAVEARASGGIKNLQLDPGQIAEGRQIAIRTCSSCHALDDGSINPKPEAPPLKFVLARYDEDALATHLIEAIRVGHGDMPIFDFNVIGADALIAYLRSIRSRHDEP